MVVVGAGPAGLACAVAAASEGAAVLILEKMPRPGLKLLASGSGRCNITSALPLEAFSGKYGEAGRFVAPALRETRPEDLLAFFEERGLGFAVEGEKVFPAEGGSRAVLAALLDSLAKSGGEIRTGEAVAGARLEEGLFRTLSTSGEILSRALAVATGGASYPRTGSTGDGWALASSFGHAIAEPAPALCPVLAKDWAFASCAGISLRGAPVALRRDGKLIRRGRGDILFTHRGLSGPAVLDLSRWIRPGDLLEVSALGTADAAEADALLRAEAAVHGARAVRSIASALGAPERLASALLARLGIDPAMKGAELGRQERLALASSLAALPIAVEALAGWEEAMATRGGVSRAEIDPKTMESRLVPGLYFAGEVIDLDGDTGGYNLQAAFSTGFLAGRSAGRRLKLGLGVRGGTGR